VRQKCAKGKISASLAARVRSRQTLANEGHVRLGQRRKRKAKERFNDGTFQVRAFQAPINGGTFRLRVSKERINGGTQKSRVGTEQCDDGTARVRTGGEQMNCGTLRWTAIK